MKSKRIARDVMPRVPCAWMSTSASQRPHARKRAQKRRFLRVLTDSCVRRIRTRSSACGTSVDTWLHVAARGCARGARVRAR
eukprot:5950295-Pleurochrysis_carterae.AAC.1